MLLQSSKKAIIDMQALSAIPVIFILISPSLHAWPIPSPKPLPPRQQNVPLNVPPNTLPVELGWSKEAIFALLGVCATFICCVIGLAWPRLRPRKGINTLGYN